MKLSDIMKHDRTNKNRHAMLIVMVQKYLGWMREVERFNNIYTADAISD